MRANIWNLMSATIELLMHAVHRTHSVILGGVSRTRLLLTLYAISSGWPNMTTAPRSIHNLHWSIPKGRKHTFGINICLSLSFLHLTSLWSSMWHVGQTIGVSYNHTVVVAQHVTMIYVSLIILVVLSMSKHLSWSILHSLWRNCSFRSRVYFAGAWSLILISLKVWSASSSWWMNRRIWHLVSSHHSSVDGPYVTMTLLLLLWSWPRSTIRRVWIGWTWNFLLTSLLILTSMIWTLIIFAISSGLRGASTHVHILLLLNAALITGNISWLWLILIFFQ